MEGATSSGAAQWRDRILYAPYPVETACLGFEFDSYQVFGEGRGAGLQNS